MKIEMNPDYMRESVIQGLTLETKKYWHLEVFSGGMPDPVAFENTMWQSYNQVKMYQNLLDTVGSITGTDLGDGTPLPLLHTYLHTKPVVLGTDLYEFKYSRSVQEFTKIRGDKVARWFLLYVTPSTARDSDYAIDSPVFMGSIGTLGSGADMEMEDVNIDVSKSYKPNDIRVQLNYVAPVA